MARFLTALCTMQVCAEPMGTSTPLDVHMGSVKSTAPCAGACILTSPLIYDSDVLGERITVPTGFTTDFASVPRLPLAYLLFGGDVGDNAAAVVHDWLYSQGKVPRATCDAVFREAMQAEGVAGWRCWPMWFGVRLFGGSHYVAAPAQPAPGK